MGRLIDQINRETVLRNEAAKAIIKEKYQQLLQQKITSQSTNSINSLNSPAASMSA